MHRHAHPLAVNALHYRESDRSLDHHFFPIDNVDTPLKALRDGGSDRGRNFFSHKKRGCAEKFTTHPPYNTCYRRLLIT